VATTLDCRAAAQQQFILSDATGGVEGLATPLYYACNTVFA